MLLKIGDKVKLKPLHQCLDGYIYIGKQMHKYWTYPFVVIDYIEHNKETFIPHFMVDGWNFEVAWIETIYSEKYLPDDLFTLED